MTDREKTVLASFAGSVAAIISNPFEVVMVRQIYDGALKSNLRRNYGTVFSGIGQILSEEGTAGLFRGLNANIGKAIALNATLTIQYDYFREKLWHIFGDMPCLTPMYSIMNNKKFLSLGHFCSSSGFITL